MAQQYGYQPQPQYYPQQPKKSADVPAIVCLVLGILFALAGLCGGAMSFMFGKAGEMGESMADGELPLGELPPGMPIEVKGRTYQPSDPGYAEARKQFEEQMQKLVPSGEDAEAMREGSREVKRVGRGMSVLAASVGVLGLLLICFAVYRFLTAGSH